MPRPRTGVKPEIAGTPAGLFAANLDRLMTRAKLTPDELAERVGITANAARKWLDGQRTPSLDQWPAIAQAVGLRDARNLLPKLPVENFSAK